jgi:opacity protein-like surface antigen
VGDFVEVFEVVFMKKIVLASLLASGLMAADSGMYLGVDLGNTEGNFEASAPSIGFTQSSTEDGSSQTLKVGYYFDKNSRISAFFHNVNVDNGDAQTYGIGYDYLIGDSAFKPFIGALAGYGSYQEDAVSDVNVAGMIYGAQVGLNYAFNEDFSAEVGYRYLKSNMEDSTIVSGQNVNFEITALKNWFVGVNYKF